MFTVAALGAILTLSPPPAPTGHLIPDRFAVGTLGIDTRRPPKPRAYFLVAANGGRRCDHRSRRNASLRHLRHGTRTSTREAMSTPEKRDAMFRRYITAKDLRVEAAECGRLFNEWWKLELADSVAMCAADAKTQKSAESEANRKKAKKVRG